MEEIWKDVPGYEGLYQVSNTGVVKSLDRVISYKNGRKHKRKGVIIKYFVDKANRPVVHICKNNQRETFFIHYLVLITFNKRKPDGCVACHNDGNPQNNHINNLRWDTQKSNMADKKKHGTHQYGENIGTSKLTNDNVRMIKQLLKHGVTQRKIANAFNVTPTMISYIKLNKFWKDITI